MENQFIFNEAPSFNCPKCNLKFDECINEMEMVFEHVCSKCSILLVYYYEYFDLAYGDFAFVSLTNDLPYIKIKSSKIRLKVFTEKLERTQLNINKVFQIINALQDNNHLI